MSTVFEIAGAVCLITAGCFVAIPLGLTVAGALLLVAARQAT